MAYATTYRDEASFLLAKNCQLLSAKILDGDEYVTFTFDEAGMLAQHLVDFKNNALVPNQDLFRSIGLVQAEIRRCRELSREQSRGERR